MSHKSPIQVRITAPTPNRTRNLPQGNPHTPNTNSNGQQDSTTAPHEVMEPIDVAVLVHVQVPFMVSRES